MANLVLIGEDGTTVVAHYAPETIVLSKKCNWSIAGDDGGFTSGESGSAGNKFPTSATFQGTTGFGMKLTVSFDDYIPNGSKPTGSVSTSTSLNYLNKLAYPTEAGDPPPIVTISLGNYAFTGVIASMTINISAVDYGTFRPLRASVDLELQEHFGDISEQTFPIFF